MNEKYQQRLYYSLFLRIEDVVEVQEQLVTYFFLLLKYFASSLPAGPGINISKILLSIIDIDNYSQKKCSFIISQRQYVIFFIYSKLDQFSQV